MTEVLTTVASFFTLAAVSTYFKQILTGESTPNPATWLIWLVVSLLNLATYFTVVHENVWIALVAIVLPIGLFVVFIFSTVKGKFAKLGPVEIISLVLAVIIGIFWQTTGNAIAANLLLQIIFLISFYPTLNGLLKGYLREGPTPWLLATVAYVLSIIALFLNLETNTWVAFGFPIVNLLGNGGIGLYVLLQRKPNA